MGGFGIFGVWGVLGFRGSEVLGVLGVLGLWGFVWGLWGFLRCLGFWGSWGFGGLRVVVLGCWELWGCRVLEFGGLGVLGVHCARVAIWALHMVPYLLKGSEVCSPGRCRADKGSLFKGPY